MICVNVKNLKIFVAGAGVDAAAVRHRAGVGDVRGGCGDQAGGLLHPGQRPRPHPPPVHPGQACTVRGRQRWGGCTCTNVKCCEMLACWLKCNEFNV